jgi:hypothetical protein
MRLHQQQSNTDNGFQFTHNNGRLKTCTCNQWITLLCTTYGNWWLTVHLLVLKGRSGCALHHASYLSWKLSHCSVFHVPFLSAVMHWAARLLKHCRRAILCGGLSHRGVARTYVHAKKTYSMTLPQCWLSTNWRPCSSTHFCQHSHL